MKKDVIYIDIEDDITSIIERVKSSSEKIIALVPPKGSTVLQSVVNLKLLKRAADSANKQPVIVTSNHALTTLAGSLHFYIAKNLQSKPMLVGATADATDEQLEVSENVGQLDEETTMSDDLTDADEVELSTEELEALDNDNAADSDKKSPSKGTKTKNKGIPNFDTFRKKLLIGGAVVLVLAIIAAAIFGRTKASVVIRAETTPVDVAFSANINANLAQSDPAAFNLKAHYQESKKTLSQTFTATGEEDRGTKASGEVTLSATCSPATFGLTIPSGTVVSAADKNFVTQETAQLDDVGPGCVLSDVVNVVAAQNGDQFNLSPRNYTVAGHASVTAKGSQMTGGTSRIVKIIAQADVDKAKEQLNQQDTAAIKDELKNAMGTDVTIFNDSFATSFGGVVSEPAVGQEANEGKLTVQATYSLLGVSNKDLGAALDAFVATKMTNQDQQRVYDNGFEGVKFEKVSGNERVAVYKITTLAQYGPQFDTEELKETLAGKKFGEMRSYLQDLPGVKGVDINLSPFWARRAPQAQRIHITLDVDKNNSGR